MIDNKKSIEVYSVELYTENMCKKFQFIGINSFNKKSLKWEQSFNRITSENFHACLRVFAVDFGVNAAFDHETTMEVLSSPNKAKMIKDFLSKGMKLTIKTSQLIEIIAKEANFTPYYQIHTIDYDNDGKSMVNFVSIEGQIFDDFDDIFVTYSYHDPEYEKLHITSACHKILDIVIVTTPGPPYSPYEKLFMPFDELTWIFLCCTFATGFLVIFIVNRMQTFVQNILYGVGARSPALNLLRIFFGIGQTRLPSNNFGRLILVSFIMFCLIFRTGYQGVEIFNFLKKFM